MNGWRAAAARIARRCLLVAIACGLAAHPGQAADGQAATAQDDAQVLPGRAIVQFESEGPKTLDKCAHCLLKKKQRFATAVADFSDGIDQAHAVIKPKSYRSVFHERCKLNARGAVEAQRQRDDEGRKQFPRRAARMARIAAQGVQPPQGLDGVYVVKSENPQMSWREICAAYPAGTVKHCGPDFKVYTAYTPPDPAYPQEWGMTKIGGPAAWDITMGAGVVVAVVDSGADLNNADLPLVQGKNFLAGTSPMDDNGHGTHVSGTVAAETNTIEAIGLAPKAKIMPLKVIEANGSGPFSAMLQAIAYAADNGADVINMSLGDPSYQIELSPEYANAINYAYTHGVVVVKAAGNDGRDISFVPLFKNRPGKPLIVVSATDGLDTLAYFSSRSATHVDLGAPGVGVVSTRLGGGTVSFSGTSMAAPHVAGAAALLLAGCPNLTVDQVRETLIANVDKTNDPAMGAGRLNIAKALKSCAGSGGPPPVGPPPGNSPPDKIVIIKPTAGQKFTGAPASVTLEADAHDPDDGVARVEYYDGTAMVGQANTPPYRYTWSPVALGAHTMRAKAIDTKGASLTSSSVTFSVTIGSSNIPPVVELGGPVELTGTLPLTHILPAPVTIEDPDNGPSPLEGLWTVITDPSGGQLSCDDMQISQPTCTFTANGTYVLELAVTDGEATTTDQLTIYVNAKAPSGNQAPIVEAGPDQTITLPARAILSGTASDPDGLPVGKLITTWSSIAGPAPVLFTSPSSLQTAATFTVPGMYTIQLKADDTDKYSVDTLKVTVNGSGGGGGGSFTLKATPDHIQAGQQVTLTWTAPTGRPVDDFIALYEQGAPHGSYRWFKKTNGATSGTVGVVFPQTTFDGTYEFRYFTDNLKTVAATSNPVVVGGVAPPPPTQVATPTISPNGGSFPTSPVMVTLATTTIGATIRYTINAADPTSATGFEYRVPFPLPLGTSPTTLRVAAFKIGMTPSAVAAATFLKTSPPPVPIPVATPTITPNGGSFPSPVRVTIATLTTSATIRYTTTGQNLDNATSGLPYNGPFNLTLGITPVTVKARAFKTGFANSAVASATFTKASANGKFAPPLGKTLLLVGSNQQAIEDYIQGIDRVPGGFMTYTSIDKLWGLDTPIDYGAGIQHAQHWVNAYPNTVLQIGLYLVGTLDAIASGGYDANIDRLADFIKQTDRPVYLRIGYEFDLPDNQYEPQAYIVAYKRIVDRFRAKNVSNVAFVWHSFAAPISRPLTDWYPGDQYVDWVAVTYFAAGQGPSLDAVVQVARAHGKPLMIAESTPRDIGTRRGQESWDDWFVPFFDFIDRTNPQAMCYIDSDWESYPLFQGQGFGDARVQEDPIVKENWLGEVGKDRYLHASPDLYDVLGYARTSATVATPTISPNGGSFPASSVMVTLTTATLGASIRYTTDGTEPKSTTGIAYIKPFALTLTTAPTTLKVRAFKFGMEDSVVASATFSKGTAPTPLQVVTPTIDPNGGSFKGPWVKVILGTTTLGASIRYTTDGTDPTSTNGTAYIKPFVLTLTTTPIVLKARAFKFNMTDSIVASATFSIDTTPADQIAIPTIDPNGGGFPASSVLVTLRTPTIGAIIRYTTNGDDPKSDTGTAYIKAFNLALSATPVTLKARAFKKDLPDSPVASATFVQQETADQGVVVFLYPVEGMVIEHAPADFIAAMIVGGLQAAGRMVLILDSREVGDDPCKYGSVQMAVTGVPAGAHTLTANLMSQQGGQLLSSATVHFVVGSDAGPPPGPGSPVIDPSSAVSSADRATPTGTSPSPIVPVPGIGRLPVLYPISRSPSQPWPPVIKPIRDPKKVKVGKTLELRVRALSRDHRPIKLEAEPLPDQAHFDDRHDGTAVFTWQPRAGQVGGHHIRITATDDRGLKDERSVTLTVVGDNHPPKLLWMPDLRATVGQTLRLTIAARDPDRGDRLKFAIAPLPQHATLKPIGTASAVFEWTPSADQVGTLSMVVSVTDGSLTDHRTLRVTVQPAPSRPVPIDEPPKGDAGDEAAADSASTVVEPSAPAPSDAPRTPRDAPDSSASLR